MVQNSAKMFSHRLLRRIGLMDETVEHLHIAILMNNVELRLLEKMILERQYQQNDQFNNNDQLTG
ncbi:MAG: hypothetical protein CUN54_10005, partial [Phototrophicales bacterium]